MAEQTKHGFTRRSFIKGAAALTAAGALVGCSPKTENLEETDPNPTKEAPEEQIFAGACAGNCAGGCFLNVHVRDGQVVRTTARDFPDPQYNRICSKGIAHVGRMYGSDRVLYPMRRIEGSERGSGEFERITWDEAINEIATKWKSYTDEYGSEAVSILSGSGNYHLASGMGPNLGPLRFQNVIGASKVAFNVDAAAAIGWVRALGGASANEGKDYLNAKTIVCWASNPSVSQLHLMHFIMEAKEKGTRYIVIDPVYNANAAKADWYVPIKAGTDGALGFGILNVLFENNWIEEDLLKTKTNAPFLVKEDGKFLRMSDLGVEPTAGKDGKKTDPYVVWDGDAGKAVAYTESANPALKEVPQVDGFVVHTAYEDAREQIAQYPPSKVAEITGVSEDDIRELARVYAEDGPVKTHSMMGVDHYFNGQYNTWTMCLVAGLTGNIGIEGGGFGIPQYTSKHLLNDAAFSPEGCLGAGRTVICKEIGNVLDTGKYIGEDLVIKSLFVQGANPMCTFAERDSVVDWFNKMEFVVVSEIAMTETASFADIILPAAYWFEQVDLMSAFGTHPYLTWTDKAVEPIGEAKPDFEIHKLICEALGYGNLWNLTVEDFLEQALDTDAARAVGCSFSEIKEKKAAKMFPEDNYIVNSTGVVPTETGRMGLYYDTIVMQEYAIGQEIDASKETKLYWEEPRYAGEHSPAREVYPFHLLSDHMRTRTHSQWFDCGYMKEYEPEPVLRINASDAAEIGVGEGDTVKVTSEFGYVVMKVNIHAGLPNKMVSSPRSFQVNEFIDGHFGSLCSKEFNQIAANMNYNDVAVAIEKM